MRIHLPSNTMPSCIEISRSDINHLNAVVRGTCISSSPPEHIHNLILGIRMPNGLVNRSDFEALMPLMANDGDDMPNALVQSTLGMIFDSYDRQQAGVADFDEIAVGLSLLSAGGKSEKLALAFEAFDGDKDGRLSRRELWKFLRAFLASILNFGKRRALILDQNSADHHNIPVGPALNMGPAAIDSLTVEAAGAIFNDVRNDGGVSFDDFGSGIRNWKLAPALSCWTENGLQ